MADVLNDQVFGQVGGLHCVVQVSCDDSEKLTATIFIVTESGLGDN